MSVMKQEIEKSVDIDESFSDDIRALRLQREKELRDNSEAIALFEISCIYGSPLPVKVVGIFLFVFERLGCLWPRFSDAKVLGC